MTTMTTTTTTTSQPSNNNNKEIDITVYGATSFVAKHVLRYLMDVVAAEDAAAAGPASTPSSQKSADQTTVGNNPTKKLLRVALSGRNATKLEAVRQSLLDYNSTTTSEVVQGQVIVADGSDLDALIDMAQNTKVVLNCAGPYAKYSSDVVNACAQMGTDYVDITGEVAWVAEMRRKFGGDAQRSGARIVSLCGYDSIPSDLAVLAAVEALQKGISSNIQIHEARIWYQAYGMANGGTIATAADMPMDLLDDWTTTTTTTTTTAAAQGGGGRRRRTLRPVPYFLDDPLCLTHPTDVRTNPKYEATKNRMAWAEWKNQLLGIEKDMLYGISLPFFMSPINLKVVHASAVALRYGDETFVAQERIFLLGFTAAKIFSIFALVPMAIVQCCIMLMVGALNIPILGKKLASLVPPGTGLADKWCGMGSNTVYCKVVGVDKTNDTDGKSYTAYSYFVYRGDAGNYVTAQCVGEAALTLVWNRDSLPPRSKDGFGTPAEILGYSLLKRLSETKVRPVVIKTSVDTPIM